MGILDIFSSSRLPVIKVDQLHPRLIIGWASAQYKKGPCLLAMQNECIISACKKNEVLIRIFSTGVNHFDYKIRQGKVVKYWKFDAPKVCGGDLAGTVEFANPKSKWKLGDRIVAATPGWRWDDYDNGTNAAQQTIDEDWCVRLPETLPLDEIGGLPMPALTAWQALASANLPGEGARVLVLNGSGGVGHLAVQLAKVHHNAYVVATTGPKHMDFLRSLGVDQAVDYTQANWEAKLGAGGMRFDAIIDLVGGEAQTRTYSLLAKTGTFAHVVTKDEYGDQPKPFIEAGQAWTHGPKYTSIEMEPDGKALEQIVEYVADGKIKFHVDSIYTLEEGQAAHDHLEEGHCQGRVLYKIRDATEE